MREAFSVATRQSVLPFSGQLCAEALSPYASSYHTELADADSEFV